MLHVLVVFGLSFFLSILARPLNEIGAFSFELLLIC